MYRRNDRLDYVSMRVALSPKHVRDRSIPIRQRHRPKANDSHPCHRNEPFHPSTMLTATLSHRTTKAATAKKTHHRRNKIVAHRHVSHRHAMPKTIIAIVRIRMPFLMSGMVIRRRCRVSALCWTVWHRNERKRYIQSHKVTMFGLALTGSAFYNFPIVDRSNVVHWKWVGGAGARTGSNRSQGKSLWEEITRCHEWNRDKWVSSTVHTKNLSRDRLL